MALLPQFQDSFDAGAFPGLDSVPANGAQDIVNGILEDDGSISRRGGTQTLGSTLPVALSAIWDGYLIPGPRTAAMGGGHVYALTGLWQDIGTGGGGGTSRPVFASDLVFWQGVGSATVWGGATSNKTSATGQAVSLTAFSKSVVGTGTTFLTNAEPGTVFKSGDRVYAVQSVEDDLHLTLSRPWAGTTGSTTANLSPVASITHFPALTAFNTPGIPWVAASLFDRYIVAAGNRVAFTPAGDVASFPLDAAGEATDYHELPVGSRVIALEAQGSRLLVFSTHGVFSIDGMAFDLTDALGNVQQRLSMIDQELHLSSELGVAQWHGEVVAPALDDIYLIPEGGAPRSIGTPIRTFYKASNQGLGQAAVYRNHYVLPLTSQTVVLGPITHSLLLCKLTSGGWVRWSIPAAHLVRTAFNDLYALGVGATSSLFLSGCFTPGGLFKDDADGTAHVLRLETRTFQGGDWYRRRWRTDLFKHQWRKARLRVEVSGASSSQSPVRASYELGHVGSTPTLLDDPFEREGS